MKKIIIVGIVLLLFVGVYFFVTFNKKTASQTTVDSAVVVKESDSQPITVSADTAPFSNTDLELEFEYRQGADGYVLKESIPADLTRNLFRTVVLTPSMDSTRDTLAASKGPTTITILVFKNPKMLSPRVWVDEYAQFSGIHLKIGDIQETVVGGENALRYLAGGLSTTDMVVVANGEYMYLMSGAYTDTESQIRKDFSSLIASVRFVTK